jgi:hypothetical protein
MCFFFSFMPATFWAVLGYFGFCSMSGFCSTDQGAQSIG